MCNLAGWWKLAKVAGDGCKCKLTKLVKSIPTCMFFMKLSYANENKFFVKLLELIVSQLTRAFKMKAKNRLIKINDQKCISYLSY